MTQDQTDRLDDLAGRAIAGDAGAMATLEKMGPGTLDRWLAARDARTARGKEAAAAAESAAAARMAAVAGRRGGDRIRAILHLADG